MRILCIISLSDRLVHRESRKPGGNMHGRKPLPQFLAAAKDCWREGREGTGMCIARETRVNFIQDHQAAHKISQESLAHT